MSNRSVYLDDDEDNWVEENIPKFSEFIRNKVKEEMNKKNEMYIKIERNKRHSLLLYLSAFGIGISVLFFSIVLNISSYKNVIPLSIESLILIIIGLALEVIAINKLYNYKSGDENVKKN
jgi:cytochrome c biogenesis protein CcdA